MTPLRAFAFSGLCGLAALGSATAFARVLHARAAAVSHEQPAWTGLPLPPGSTAESLRASGHTLYLNSCAHCHGADARGDEGPDLHGLEVSDRRIANVIRHGIAGEMPSFAKKHSPEEIAALIAYLRTLE